MNLLNMSFWDSHILNFIEQIEENSETAIYSIKVDKSLCNHLQQIDQGIITSIIDSMGYFGFVNYTQQKGALNHVSINLKTIFYGPLKQDNIYTLKLWIREFGESYILMEATIYENDANKILVQSTHLKRIIKPKF